MGRRTVLQSAAALAVGRLALDGGVGARARPAPAATGDFAFLAGEWRIANRMMHQGALDRISRRGDRPFACSPAMAASRNCASPRAISPASAFASTTPPAGVWNDHWVNGQQRVVNAPMSGTFENGVGTFIADDEDNGAAIKARGVWDRITPTSCRWHQAVSRDGGATWEMNWEMHWTRV